MRCDNCMYPVLVWFFKRMSDFLEMFSSEVSKVQEILRSFKSLIIQ